MPTGFSSGPDGDEPRMSAGAKPFLAHKGYRSDDILVRECLLGTESAWTELVDKYRNLIYSIPIRSGFSPDDASEIFQSVCLMLLRDLRALREPQALPAWLIRLTTRKCASFRKDRLVHNEIQPDSALETRGLPEAVMEQVEREQMFREALAEGTPECARLIRLLFLEHPPLSYDQAAAALGLARGSIGATRMRCLEKLRRTLEKKGFR
jgi:RNA polymerase sigma factor (sigma-70 family)